MQVDEVKWPEGWSVVGVSSSPGWSESKLLHPGFSSRTSSHGEQVEESLKEQVTGTGRSVGGREDTDRNYCDRTCSVHPSCGECVAITRVTGSNCKHQPHCF